MNVTCLLQEVIYCWCSTQKECVSQWCNGWWVGIICQLSTIWGKTCIIVICGTGCCVLLKNSADGGFFDTVSQVIFLGIDNIHSMRDSLTKMREFLDTHGACSSDGSSSLLVCKIPFSVALNIKGWCQLVWGKRTAQLALTDPIWNPGDCCLVLVLTQAGLDAAKWRTRMGWRERCQCSGSSISVGG